MPLFFLFAFILVLSQREVSAQSSIPLMIPHSGTVSVGGTLFNGNGLFKFAIVNKDCTQNIAATCATLWSNDNTLGAGVEPAAAVTIPVTNGAFTVKLGDTGLTNMLDIPTTVFNNAETYLRIWFNDGATGSQQLSPDRQLVSVPYAYQAEVANSVTATAAPNLAGLSVDTSTLVVDAPNDRVGIGTTTPGEKLTVVGSGNTSATSAFSARKLSIPLSKGRRLGHIHGGLPSY
ncbi:MAG: hypothetical protein HY204_05655 [Nitrospirae bacterium]|nr:hypothetical protein [Nitrospirota bacterium]